MSAPAFGVFALRVTPHRGVVFAVFLCACAHAPAPVPTPTLPVVVAPRPRPADEARAVIRHFVEAVEAGELDAAWPLLSDRWRQRYSRERLAADLAREPLAKARLTRLRAHLEGELNVTETVATLALEEGRTATLVREGSSWRLDALE
jgi:hypothetical protein